ncbi:MAG: bifunctional adenosylcobinamide kinase/adenosylcobinamide-phosphate guanylyltransferase [Oscillospiraceae bacterium]|nr:bifunctional adenosylcobinamide kinase/adenosylcobinamide-phosphate guanylyltransferase [Oscillospiraceae bacterium]
MVYFITGGASSGKSLYAEGLFAGFGKTRIYLATMENIGAPEQKIVDKHRRQREHLGFTTIEISRDIGRAEIPGGAAVLVEDLSNLAANEYFGGGDVSRVVSGLRAVAQRAENTVIVGNEIFSGGFLYDDETRAYLELMGRISCEIAGFADRVITMKAGLPWVLK